MILFPLITNPVPEERRTESERHGASQTGCWLKFEIWITDLSGDAPNPARSARKRIKLPVNLLNTPEDGRAVWIGQAYGGRFLDRVQHWDLNLARRGVSCSRNSGRTAAGLFFRICSMTEVFRVRMERDLIRRASKVPEEIGTSSGEVVRLMFTQMVKRRTIPFPLQADVAEEEVLSRAERRSKMWDAMNEGKPKAR